MATTVTYKGNTLTTVDNQTKILNTSGTYLEDNITLVDVSSGGGGGIYQDQDGYLVLSDEGGGGGGASNIVTGTFKGTTVGKMDINLPYSGTGYPIGLMIVPTEGPYNETGTFYSLVRQYVTVLYWAYKGRPDVAPDYTENSTANQAYRFHRFKSSSSKGTTHSSSIQSDFRIYNSTVDVSASATNVCLFKSNKVLSVYIHNQNASSYGFAANVEYTYHVIYSS